MKTPEYNPEDAAARWQAEDARLAAIEEEADANVAAKFELSDRLFSRFRAAGEAWWVEINRAGRDFGLDASDTDLRAAWGEVENAGIYVEDLKARAFDFAVNELNISDQED